MRSGLISDDQHSCSQFPGPRRELHSIMPLTKQSVIKDILEFLESCNGTSTITCNLNVARIDQVTSGRKPMTIHGLKNSGGPTDEIESQGSASFFRPKSDASIRDIHKIVSGWVKTKGWHMQTVVAQHNLQCSPFFEDEEKLNFVVFFAVSPKTITVNALTGCALPGTHGNQYSVFGQWNKMNEKLPQTMVYDRIPKPKPAGNTLQKINSMLKHQMDMMNNLDKSFLEYTP